MTETRYKFLRLTDDNRIKSDSGDCTWRIGEWRSIEDDDLVMCESGFHCSQQIYQAFTYVQGEILAEVEVDGDAIFKEDKEAWQRMRLIRCWKWCKEDSVALSIFAAELVLENFEKSFPEDTRPRAAIEAARTWLAAPTEENMFAAESAAESAARSVAESAARSVVFAARSVVFAARSVEFAARSAEFAARSVARSAARSVARSAARSVVFAARSAEFAARFARSAEFAARFAIIEKIAVWMEERVGTLEEVAV